MIQLSIDWERATVPAMRVQVWEGGTKSEPWFRILELSGSAVTCWAPGLEHDDPEGALDRGGFDSREDATAFALGVDRWRAEVGLIAESVEEIDTERRELDQWRAPIPEIMFRRSAA
jgi:hypothetical protein